MEAAIDAAVASSTELITDVLVTNIPVVFLVAGGLIALGVIWRIVRRAIGRKM